MTANPNQTVVRFEAVGLEGVSEAKDRKRVVGDRDIAESAGPTSAAFGRTESDDRILYVPTTGGLIRPVGDAPGLARILKVDTGIRGEAVW